MDSHFPRFLVLIAFLSTSFSASGQETGLPIVSFELVKKMEEFENNTFDQAIATVDKKRNQVIRILETHLQETTRSGNLDGALQIRKKIEELKLPIVFPAPKAGGVALVAQSKPEPLSTEGFDLLGSIWKGLGGKLKGGTLQFFENGKMVVIDSAAPRPYNGWRYRIDEGSLFITPSDSHEEKIKFSRKNTRFEIPDWGELERIGPPSNWFVGHTWAVIGSEYKFAFQADKSATKLYQETTTPLQWEVLESGAIRVTGGGPPEYFWLDSDRKGERTGGEERVNGRPMERD